MTLTNAGKIYFRSLIGGGGRSNSNVTVRDISGDTTSISVSPNFPSMDSGYPYWLFVGGDPVLDDSNNVFKLASALSTYFYPGGGASTVATTTDGNAKTTYSYQYVNSSSESRVLTHYGFGFSKGANTLLLSYHQFPEPITIQAGETKTIQITIDVSNI